MMNIKLLLLVGIAFLVFISSINATPLDDYVNKFDPYTNYTLLTTYSADGYNAYILNFTSQKWYDESVLNRPVWWHFLCICIPTNILRPELAFMLIDGGSNHPDLPPAKDLQELGLLSVSTGSVIADLKQIPNQPIIFKKDPAQQSRTEDFIIAWTWKEFIENTSDPYILLRMPMTKAAVRGMDAIQDFALKKAGVKIEKFVIGGASKRGWTTWTTAAVDNKRVVGAIPIVMDFLYLNRNMHHHYKSLGGWTFAFKAYYELNITGYIDKQEFFQMEQIVDPASYLSRYYKTQFLVINCAGDEFFLADDSDYYWDDLRTATNGTALKRLIPNAEHSLEGHLLSIFASIRSLFLNIYEKQKLPSLKWARPNNSSHGIITVTVDIKNGPVPSDVRVYYAKTLDNKRRDFRLLIANPDDPTKPQPHPVIWLSTQSIIAKNSTNDFIIYEAAFPRPLSGWFGFYFQLSFPSIDSTDHIVTSETNIIPETFPFPDCYAEGCTGTLV